MVVQFVAIQTAQRFVKLRPRRVVANSTFEKIFAERDVLALCFDPQRLARLRGVIESGDACIPRHVPCRHVPEKNHVWLKRRRLTKKPDHTCPVGPFPGHMRLDENDVRDNCAESTQCRDEAELSDLLAEAEAEIDAPQVQLALRA